VLHSIPAISHFLDYDSPTNGCGVKVYIHNFGKENFLEKACSESHAGDESTILKPFLRK
jgi:hypothetical protein